MRENKSLAINRFRLQMHLQALLSSVEWLIDKIYFWKNLAISIRQRLTDAGHLASLLLEG